MTAASASNYPAYLGFCPRELLAKRCLRGPRLRWRQVFGRKPVVVDLIDALATHAVG
jgi:hypothetical protein